MSAQETKKRSTISSLKLSVQQIGLDADNIVSRSIYAELIQDHEGGEKIVAVRSIDPFGNEHCQKFDSYDLKGDETLLMRSDVMLTPESLFKMLQAAHSSEPNDCVRLISLKPTVFKNEKEKLKMKYLLTVPGFRVFSVVLYLPKVEKTPEQMMMAMMQTMMYLQAQTIASTAGHVAAIRLPQ